jgi:hypothetical protein
LACSRLYHGLHGCLFGEGTLHSTNICSKQQSNEIHLILNGGERTWEPKGIEHVQVLGLEDKRQITILISCNDVTNLLPPPIVFTSTTFRTFPPNNQGKKYLHKK